MNALRAIIIDYNNFFKKLSLKKTINFFKVFFSFNISKIIKKPIVWGLPNSVSIEPTTSCNLHCLECPSGQNKFSRNTGNIDFEFYKSIVNELYPYLSYLILYFQGEPYLHPIFFELINYANKKNIYTATSTNGHFLNEENAKKTILSGLHRLIISVDGTTQDIYSFYRKGGELNRVKKGIENIVKLKKELKSETPYLIIQFLVIKQNQHQIEEAKRLAKQLNVDKIIFKTAQIYDYKNGSELIPTINKYSRYKKVKNTFLIKSKLPNRCWRLWNSSVITWDGLIVPCCFDKDAKYILGNLSKAEFKHVWKSKKYQTFRKNILYSRKNINICQNCTEGMNVFK